MSAYLVFTREKTLDEAELDLLGQDSGNPRRSPGQGPRQVGWS